METLQDCLETATKASFSLKIEEISLKSRFEDLRLVVSHKTAQIMQFSHDFEHLRRVFAKEAQKLEEERENLLVGVQISQEELREMRVFLQKTEEIVRKLEESREKSRKINKI